MSDDGDIQVHHDIRSSSPAPGTPDEKRRSTRNTKRKQYKDDIDLNLSEDEKPEEDHPEGIAEIRNVSGWKYIPIESLLLLIFFLTLR